MRFKRNIGYAALGCTLLAGGAPAAAAPGDEPLLVTRLSDPETGLVAVSGGGQGSPIDQEIRSFARALDQAAAAERQALAARCKAVDSIPRAGPARLAWEASCRYQRR